ncbi:6-pyruvoyl tetrahydrobiopterin synthase-like [Panonychus citri]|uniref:6-pyruvoyl tetrahydrobiopterin synthase-like n=1 Tax=Panonychus citri TaxID=50023 RepID=UPI00230782BE|nr:6-pyruvoyl tetrahydrobiopterin synthase-like [Panonychus citri]
MDKKGSPIVYLTKKISFSAAHRLNSSRLDSLTNGKIYGKCNNINGHGHNYRVEVNLRGPIDEETGMLINLTQLKRIMEQVIETVDHKFIDRDVPYFIDSGKVSTVENISVYLYDSVKEKLPRDILYSVIVHETDDNVVEYRGEKIN